MDQRESQDLAEERSPVSRVPDLIEGVPRGADLVDGAGVRQKREEYQRLPLAGIGDRRADRRAPSLERAIEQRLGRGGPVRVRGETARGELADDAVAERPHEGFRLLALAVPH